MTRTWDRPKVQVQLLDQSCREAPQAVYASRERKRFQVFWTHILRATDVLRGRPGAERPARKRKRITAAGKTPAGGREYMLAMKSFFITWRARFEREEGQALVEYALILGLVSVVAIAVLQIVGQDITAILGAVTSALSSALPG
jgi:pilus assembly protein Flp/PilA